MARRYCAIAPSTDRAEILILAAAVARKQFLHRFCGVRPLVQHAVERSVLGARARQIFPQRVGANRGCFVLTAQA